MRITCHPVAFLNVYRRGDSLYAGGMYRTRIEADRVAKPWRANCVKVRFTPEMMPKRRSKGLYTWNTWQKAQRS